MTLVDAILVCVNVMLRSGWARERRSSFASWALLAGMLPSLLWLGHWSVRVPVPGSGSFLAVGMAAENHAQRADAGKHGSHCHGEPSCSDAPPAPVSVGVAVVSKAIALLGLSGLLVPAAMWAWRPGRPAQVEPPVPPPRGLALA